MMPATPAWPPESSVRLFVEAPLAADLILAIDGQQAHYLTHVMRLRAGSRLALCDDISGEWLAEIVAIDRRAVSVRIIGRSRQREAVPDLWLAAAPIRRARFDLIAEKACELGIARLIPVLTRRAVVDKVKPARLRAQMIEAAEQCGRTALPEIVAEVRLADWLPTLGDRHLFVADEAGGMPAAQAFANYPGAAAILIGPEGGFDDDERRTIMAQPSALAISLGPRILRAETAAIAAIAAWMAVVGDWPTPR